MPFMLSSLDERVSRCGVELELLSRDDSYGDYDDDDEDWDPDEGCNCSDCRRAVARRSRGVSSGSNVSRMLSAFRGYGLTDSYDLHEYHCSCEDCRYDRPDGFFAAQRDCTVGMEYVSKILSVHDTSDMDNLGLVPSALAKGYNETGWRPDGYRNNGNHIHVAIDGSGTDRHFRESTVESARDWLWALSAEVNLGPVADGGCGQIRDYNGGAAGKTLREDDESGMSWNRCAAGTRLGTSWFSQRHATMEFRLFNTPRLPERVPMHVAASVAMLRWSLTMAIRYRELRTPLARDAHLEDAGHPRIGRQIVDCLPAMACTDATADLITSAFHG